MNTSFGIGPMEMVILALLTGSGTGTPVAMPPGPEDPILVKLAPAECLFFSSWAGTAKPNAASANRTEQMLADPQVQKFIGEAGQKMLGTLQQSMGNAGPNDQARVELLLKIAQFVASRPGMAYVSDFTIRKNQPPFIKAGFVFNVEGANAEAQGFLEKIRQSLPPEGSTKLEIGGVEFQRLQLGQDAPTLTWGLRGKYLIGGLGDNEVESMMQRARQEVPAWLTSVRARLSIPRVSTITFLNLAKIIRLVETIDAAENGPDSKFKVPQFLTSYGLNGLGYFANVSGLDDKGCVSRTVVTLQGTPSGLFSWLDLKPLGNEDLKAIPKDSPVAIVTKLDLLTALNQVLRSTTEFHPENAKELLGDLERVKQRLGFDLRDDVLASLGDVWRIYANPDAGGLLTGWTIVAPVTNSQKLKPVYEQLMQMAELGLGGPNPPAGGPSLKKTAAGSTTVYSLKLPIPGVPIAPTWCLTEKELVVGASPAAISAITSGVAPANSLASQPELAPYLNGKSKPLMVTYLDSRQLSETFTPLIQMAMSQVKMPGAVGPPGVAATVPRANIEKYLLPTVVALHRAPDGVELVSQQTMPIGNMGAMAPVGAALLLPAIQKARSAARQTQSANNLKQLILAYHNYHEAYRAGPAAYSVDENGKPLLSWRVHLLPYLDEGELYKKFRLNEPWDSEHNKALIPLMPKVYRSSESKAEPGKTVYLGVRGKDGIFVPAKGTKGRDAQGVSIVQISDGTSRTIAIVEANDDSAVIWTKPDDFNPDEVDYLKALVGLRPGNFVVAFADGSVRVVPVTANRDGVMASFTKSGGEAIGIAN